MKFIRSGRRGLLGGIFLLWVGCFWGAGCSRQQRAEKLIANADRYYQAREFDKAHILYRNVLRNLPTNSHAILRLGKISYFRGQMEEAFPYLVEGFRHQPEDNEAAEQISSLLLAAGQPIPARTEVQKLLARQPTNLVGLRVFLDSSRTPTELDAVRQFIDQKQPQAPGAASFHVARAFLALRDKDTNTAEREFQLALKTEPQSSHINQAVAMYRWSQGATNAAEIAFRTAVQFGPPHDLARLNMIRFLINGGRTDEAKNLLEETTRLAPEHTMAWVMRGEMELNRGKLEECRKLLDQAFLQGPNDLSARMLLVRLLLAEKKPGEAVRVLKAVAERRPKVAEVQYQLGLAQLMNDETEAGTASLAKASTLDPNHILAVAKLAELNLMRGQASLAVDALLNLNRVRPGQEIPQLLLARAYTATGQTNEALRVYRAMQTQFPSNAAAHYHRGELLAARADSAIEAKAAFERAALLAPNDLRPVEQLVDMEIKAKAPAKALALLQPVLARYTNSPQLWCVLARIRSAEQNPEATKAALEKAIEIQPDFQPAYLMLASWYLSRGKLEDSLGAINDLVKRNPKDLKALALSGMINSQLKNYDAAERAYQQALTVNSNFMVALNNQAYILAEIRNRPEDAFPLAKRAHQLAPNDPSSADTLGWIEFRRGNFAEAYRWLTEAQRQLAGQPEVEAHLGLASSMVGEETTARTALTSALKTPAPFPGREAAERQLTILDLDPNLPPTKRIEVLLQRRQENPKDVAALVRLATAHSAAGELTKARDAWDLSLKLSPTHVGALIGLVAAETELNPARARTLSRQLLALAPNDPKASRVIGRLDLRTGDVEVAYSALQNITQSPKATAQDWYDLATAAFGTGRLPESVAAALRATKLGLPALQASSAEALVTFLTFAQTPTAAPPPPALFAQVLKADPTNGPALYAQAFLLQQTGKYAEAKDSHESLLRRFPGFTPSTRQLALLFANYLNNDARAYELATKARASRPNDHELAKTIGILTYRRGDHREAARLLGDVASHLPKDADVQYHLGLANWRLKKTAEARKALASALALDPNGALAAEARKILAEK